LFAFAPTEASFIRIEGLSNHSGSATERLFIGETIFEGTLVPEPTTCLLLGSGLAALGFSRERKRH
jgi:hypothetical protein